MGAKKFLGVFRVVWSVLGDVYCDCVLSERAPKVAGELHHAGPDDVGDRLHDRHDLVVLRHQDCLHRHGYLRGCLWFDHPVLDEYQGMITFLIAGLE